MECCLHVFGCFLSNEASKHQEEVNKCGSQLTQLRTVVAERDEVKNCSGRRDKSLGLICFKEVVLD